MPSSPFSTSTSTKTKTKTKNQKQKPLPLSTSHHNYQPEQLSTSSNSNSEEQSQLKKKNNHTRLSIDSQSTDNLSSNTILTPPHHPPPPLIDQSNQLASNLTTTKISRKRKPTAPIQDHSLYQRLPTHQKLKHLPLQSTPKRLKTEPIKPSSKIHPSKRPTPSAPKPATTAPEFFFTTHRFQTPGRADSSTSTIANRDSHPPSSGNSKARTKQTHQISSNHHQPRTRSSRTGHHDLSSSAEDEQPPTSYQKLISSSSQPHTPRHPRNPHIYGRQDQQADGEMSLVMAETPMHHKNRQFRRGAGQSGKTKNDQLDPGHGPGTPLSSQSLQSLDPGHGNGRRGSRASSIGSGHDALPHPRILPSVLCRHIRTDLPPSMRCRTLLSWCSQKAEHVTYTMLNPSFKPTRYIAAELPKPLARTLGQLVPLETGPKSKLLARVAKSTLKNFIRGICENQVEISWGIPIDSDDDHEVSVENLSIRDLQALPPHPQDLKNEHKIEELTTWRVRTSYEDHARQHQLNRYGKLIERMAEKIEPTTEDLRRSNRFCQDGNSQGNGDSQGWRIDTKLLVDPLAVVEFGRFLRSNPHPPPKSIDVLDELGIDWVQISSKIGMIQEAMDRVKKELIDIEARMIRLQMSSTSNLKRVCTDGMLSGIEAKILLASSDGVQLCLNSLTINEPPFQLVLTHETGPGPIGKRDLLRALSRSSHLL